MRFWFPALLCLVAVAACADVRPPAVAGSFYPGSPAELRQQVEALLGQAPAGSPAPLALVVPHAGYVYSGAAAAKGFAAMRSVKVERVVVLAPSHRKRFSGGALPAGSITAFETPLGQIPLDPEAVKQLRACDDFDGPASAHDQEHSLEVELPFIQVVAPDATIVPVVVGPGTDDQVARRMARCLSGLMQPGTVIVVSSDFTHHGRAYGYAPFDGAPDVGAKLIEVGTSTGQRIAAIDPRGFWKQVEVSGDTVCGARPIMILLELLDHAFKGQGRIVEVTTSGHVSRRWDQAVTYVSVAFNGSWQSWQEAPKAPTLGTLKSDERQALLALARATLQSHLAHDASLADWFASHPGMSQLEALAGSFVTVHNTGAKASKQGRLRACMGIIEARMPLVDAVIHAAVSAAHDPRFPRLQYQELAPSHLEVSVLSPTHEVSGPEAIEVGKHGVVLSKRGRSAVFLPQVAVEQGWDRDTMLSQLSRKAGLPADAWKQGATFEVYTAQVISEEE
jgi:AmmeMemoRadiSam system protein B/AmmeMemoRadiSam system protein A